jgi:hypothetical protein
MPDLQPLSDLYSELGLALPRARELPPDAVPEPQRALLVHDEDMTPTLEAAYGARIHLRVLRYSISNNVMSRLVVLALDESEEAVEVGAIRIFLDRLPEAARSCVLGLRQPFGSILREFGVTHYSHPSAYFEVAPDALMAQVLSSNGAQALYGRRNILHDAEGRVLAEVVEILPPASGSGSL